MEGKRKGATGNKRRELVRLRSVKGRLGGWGRGGDGKEDEGDKEEKGMKKGSEAWKGKGRTRGGQEKETLHQTKTE